MSPPEGIGAGPAVVVRRRADRRRCPSCRYDRTGLPLGAVCPECGALPPKPGGIGAGERASSRATIALGMGLLGWIGLVGFGVPAIILGLSSCVLAAHASGAQAEQADPETSVRSMIIAAYALGGGAAAAGVGVSALLAFVL